MDPMGGIVITNDGNAILREIDCNHPAAKSMIELARAQDEEVGDGTTSVIILAGELMVAARPFIEQVRKAVLPFTAAKPLPSESYFAPRVCCTPPSRFAATFSCYICIQRVYLA